MKYFFISIYILLSISAGAQFSKVSDMVKQEFDKQYPEAKEVDWKGGLDMHTVTFRLIDKKYKTLYTKDGSWVSTETSIPFENLSKTLKLSFGASNYKTWTVKECFEIVKPRAEANEYKIIVQKSSINKKILLFDAKGRLYEELRSL
jgi:hypothetical protein